MSQQAGQHQRQPFSRNTMALGPAKKLALPKYPPELDTKARTPHWPRRRRNAAGGAGGARTRVLHALGLQGFGLACRLPADGCRLRARQVDMRKVNLEVLKPWIATRITELLGGVEDEVLIGVCACSLLCPRRCLSRVSRLARCACPQR
jgi:hypothetical protein